MLEEQSRDDVMGAEEEEEAMLQEFHIFTRGEAATLARDGP